MLKMNKKKLFLFLMLITFAVTAGCGAPPSEAQKEVTEKIMSTSTNQSNNTMTKRFGGEQVIVLEKGLKLMDIDWKFDALTETDSLWIQTRKMREDDIAEEYMYKEKSTFGLIEGTVIIKEQK